MTHPRRATTILGILSLAAASSIAPAQDEPAPAAPPAPPAPEPAAAPGAAPDAGAQNNALANEITPELDAAVTRGLSALASMQADDGSWGGVRFERHVAITALGALAMMSDGNLPGRGPYGRNVERALDFILANISETGLIAADQSHGPMYGHGFATLFLGEIYGMTAGGPDTAASKRAYEALSKACRLIVQTQNDEGGWRYNPVPADADISVTICQIMALRSARNAGLDIPKATIDRAVKYVRDCQNPDGGFRYQMMTGGSAWPRSAAGVASLFYAGIYKDDAIDRGLQYLQTNAMPGRGLGVGSHYFYGHYYAVQTMYLAGAGAWATWWPAIRDELIHSQDAKDGGWDDNYAGQSYGTAMALIILQMPKRYLPIFQK